MVQFRNNTTRFQTLKNVSNTRYRWTVNSVVIQYSYPIFVFDVDTSSFVNKVFQSIFKASFFCCQVQGSPLMENKETEWLSCRVVYWLILHIRTLMHTRDWLHNTHKCWIHDPSSNSNSNKQYYIVSRQSYNFIAVDTISKGPLYTLWPSSTAMCSREIEMYVYTTGP